MTDAPSIEPKLEYLQLRQTPKGAELRIKYDIAIALGWYGTEALLVMGEEVYGYTPGMLSVPAVLKAGHWRIAVIPLDE